MPVSKSIPSVAGDSYTNTTLAVVPTLRDYQLKLLKDIYGNSVLGWSSLVYAPTGAGKTVVIAAFAAKLAVEGKQVFICVSADVLVSQTVDQLRRFGLEPGIIKAGWKENREALVQVISLQSLLSRHWWKELIPSVIIFDECHHTAWLQASDALREQFPDATPFGFTATPFRTNKGEAMGDKFERLITAPFPRDLIQKGYLVKPVYYTASGIDGDAVNRVKKTGNDFDESELSSICNNPTAIAHIVRAYKQRSNGRRAILFAVNIQHSKDACGAYNAANIPAAHIDGSTSPQQRQALIEKLYDGEIKVLCSCEALEEGFDCPPVEVAMLCRPTKSRSKHIQQIGRVLRPFEEKTDCIIFDQAGNVARFGFIESISREDIRLDKGIPSVENVAPTKACPACEAIISTFLMECPQCGHIYPQVLKTSATQELERLLIPGDKPKFKFLRQRILEGWNHSPRPYKPGWAKRCFEEMFGYVPPKDWFRGAIFGDEPHELDEELYADFLFNVAESEGYGEGWVNYWMSCEFGGAH
jgi:superfamily II DNA or RNA helicase